MGLIFNYAVDFCFSIIDVQSDASKIFELQVSAEKLFSI